MNGRTSLSKIHSTQNLTAIRKKPVISLCVQSYIPGGELPIHQRGPLLRKSVWLSTSCFMAHRDRDSRNSEALLQDLCFKANISIYIGALHP